MIDIHRDLKSIIRYQAAHAYPNECCGMLIGTRDGDKVTVVEVVAAPNVSESPADSFEIDPQSRLTLQKLLRGTPREIVGHYHSHPDGEAAPSERDREQLLEPDLYWIVASVNQGGVGEMGIFRFDQDAAAFVPAEEAPQPV